MSTRPLPFVARRLSLDFYRLLLFGLMALYCSVFTQLAFDLHAGMRTHKADLGQIDQAVWNSSRGRFVEMTDNGFIATRMTDHVEPILALISPIFWLWNDVRALLLLQVVLVALGAWPLYELALRRFDHLLSTQEKGYIWLVEPLRQLTRPLALALALAYLLTPQLQSAVLTEFHAAPLAVPFILWAFWAIEGKHWAQFVVATLLVAVVKEEIALLAAGLGMWALWRLAIDDVRLKKAPRYPLLLALLVTLLSLAWFYLTTFVIVPAHAQAIYQGTASVYFRRYGALGDSPVDIFKSFVTQPGMVWQIATEPARLNYLWGLLAPFGFFSLLAPEILLLTLPVLLANLLSAYPAQYYGEFHYSAPLMPYFAVSAAYGLGRIWCWLGHRMGKSSASFQHLPAASAPVMALAAFGRNSRTTLRPLLALVLGLWLVVWAGKIYHAAGRGPWAARYDPTAITAHDQLLARFVAQLPAAAAVTATAAVHPHVSHRRFVYQFPIGLAPPGDADWALLDVTTNTDMAPGDVKAQVDHMLAGAWGVVDGADGFLLLHKGVENKVIPPAFYDFARTPAAKPTAAEPNTPAWQFKQLAVDDWPRWRQTKITVVWSISPQFNPTVPPSLAIVTPNGETIATLAEAAPPALVWYPPTRWQPGDVVQLTTLPLYLPATWGVLVSSAPDGEKLAGLYQRITNDQLMAVPTPAPASSAEPAAVPNVSEPLGHAVTGAFKLAPDQTIQVSSWLPTAVWPARPLDVRLQWRGVTSWPQTLTAFIHLRQQAKNIAQGDGPPRYFSQYPISQKSNRQSVINDWRQLTLPAYVPPNTILTVVIGLYNPQTGQRVEVMDANGKPLGNELPIGQVKVQAAPVPDQACALIPQTCAAQSTR